MKRMRKWMMVTCVALATPTLFAGGCATGLRDALIEGTFSFAEESVVETFQHFIPIGELLGGEGQEEEH